MYLYMLLPNILQISVASQMKYPLSRFTNIELHWIKTAAGGNRKHHFIFIQQKQENEKKKKFNVYKQNPKVQKNKIKT